MHPTTQHDHSEQSLQSVGKNVNTLVAIAQIIGLMLCPWLRRPCTAGSHFYSGRAVLSWLFIPIFGALFHAGTSLALLMVFWLATTLLLLINRSGGLVLRRPGYRQHSLYGGTPWIRGNERAVKVLVEPVVALVIGGLIRTFDVPLGSYLMLAAACLGINCWWQWMADESRIRAIRDSQLEGELVSGWIEDQ